ncbi:formate C-acetyltransferase [Clostridium aminobutyricum]|uniref:Formate acetyltransferase n=1 Tax=Clostridium aminobutyricum TaxID=33953 RepID=A0A939DAA6_CLOAM|nr:formate C-acetyltransferase [Clostridium aminobutyricum]MBN7774015.1 formate C-acetyltransferase [Clostridium aminobutyricum]
MSKAWEGFKNGEWNTNINVDNFIDINYTPYEGDENFLAGPTARTEVVSEKVQNLLNSENDNNGVLKVDASRIMRITAFPPGYIDKDRDIIVGLQTDEPLKRGVCPFGGIRMARQSAEAYGTKLADSIEETFKYVTSHNDGVFSVYSDEMMLVRKVGLITGLPDSYGRGRIIGDYRRAALYGIDSLIENKKNDKKQLCALSMTEDNIRLIEEVQKQISALEDLKVMAASYGFDISKPAQNTKEAIQWLYFAYLGAIKEENGAAMSIGRTSTFIDIYAERDLANGIFTEEQIQEFVDDFILKIRVARHLRTPEYNELFAGDPMWITEGLGGMGADGRTKVTKTSFRYLNTLYNLGPSPEPNLTILWSKDLPEGFKRFCAQVSIDTDSIQYENDDVMRHSYGDDYSIACCVSAIEMGKQMQFFGARYNLAKILCLALNGGIDERTGLKVGPQMDPIKGDGPIEYEEAMRRFNIYKEWLCELYVNIMNVIHYMHDKYDYERSQMAFLNTKLKRLMAFGVAGLSVAADSFSAIKYAKVYPIRNEQGIIVDYRTEGEFPKYGNDDDRVDNIAVELTKGTIESLRKHPTYRNAVHTLSVLTITSNVVYGKKTGNTPDGRRAGEPFAPGANPMHCRDSLGAVASLNSVAKVKWEDCQDGVSYTFSITPDTLGKDKETQKDTLVGLMGGYFDQGAHHLNVNVLNRELLLDACEHPEKYPNLTIRVSGYAVKFNSLSKEHQKEVIARTFHQAI